MKLLLSPHNDDEALFAAYTLLRHRPLVLTCLDGARKASYPTVSQRVAESAAAMTMLGCDYDHLWIPVDDRGWQEEVESRVALRGIDPEHVWAPFPEPDGHRHHNRLGELATRLWPGRVSFYSTYTHTDATGVRRSTQGSPVPYENGWPELKRRALDCYRTQIEREGTRMHFTQPLDEYEVPTLRLNLGGEINRIPGFVNMDSSYGWRFEDGLGMWGDGAVEAVTESHALMYLPVEEWPALFAEIARVLQPGGTVRITQDAIGASGSRRPVIRPGAAVATTAELVLDHLAAAGIQARIVEPDESGFVDGSLVQQNYGQPPDVFHVEAVKSAAEQAVAA